MENFVADALAIEEEEALNAGMMGYMARIVVQAAMPYKKVVGNEYTRKNGNYTLSIMAPSKIGLPYGSLPRLLVSWATTEAIKTKSRELILGNSLSSYMNQLEIIPTGGRWGSIVRFKDQMKRLFSSHISCSFDDTNNFAIDSIKLIKSANLWWNPKEPTQATIFDSTITLGEEFFSEIIKSPVPIDIRALKALRKSPMAIDIYCWLTYRMSYLKKDTVIPFDSLQVQFGGDYKKDRYGRSNFRKEFKKQLKKVLLLYPEANISEELKGIKLQPSKSHIIINI